MDFLDLDTRASQSPLFFFLSVFASVLARSHSHTLTHIQSHTHSHSHTRTHIQSHTHSHALSRTHSFTHPLTHTHVMLNIQGKRRGWHKSEAAMRQPEPCGIVETSPPFHLKPMGAAFMLGRDADAERCQSLGSFAVLSDEVLLLLLEYLRPKDLAKLACVSRYMQAFASHDELWLTHCEALFQQPNTPFSYHQSWKSTFLAQARRQCTASTAATASPNGHTAGDGSNPNPDADNADTLQPAVFSDYLYSSWFYAAACIDPAWLEEETMDRASVSLAAFKEQYESQHKPVILRGLASSWPAAQRWKQGGISTVCSSGAEFKAGSFSVTLPAFQHYCRHQCDQRPLYIFDKHFADKCPALAQQYR